MEIQQARYFVALCETLNFTRAAERSNVTQPSLTRAIKLLEDELGGPLFNRERNRTHLTELGRLVEPHIREVMAQAQTARTRTRGKTPGNRNPLIRFCFLNIVVDSIPGRTQVLRQVAQQPRAR
jgi:DNA-binding transcriptional LysR family regulator